VENYSTMGIEGNITTEKISGCIYILEPEVGCEKQIYVR
jgi:hypothetical protein